MLQSGDYEHQIVWAEYDLGDKLRASKAAEAALTAARTACENAFSGAPSHRRKALRARLGIYDASALVLHDNWPGMSVEGVTYPREDWVARLYATCVGSESGIELIEVLSSTSDPSAFVKKHKLDVEFVNRSVRMEFAHHLWILKLKTDLLCEVEAEVKAAILKLRALEKGREEALAMEKATSENLGRQLDILLQDLYNQGQMPFDPHELRLAYMKSAALRGYGGFERLTAMWPWSLKLVSAIAGTEISILRGRCQNCATHEHSYTAFLTHIGHVHLGLNEGYVADILARREDEYGTHHSSSQEHPIAFGWANLRLAWLLDQELQGQSRQRRYITKTGN